MSHTKPPTTASPGRYPVRIPIRMTDKERAVIGQSACASNRSISRYLVELATLGKSPTPLENQARLTFLQALFQGASEKMQAMLASERFTQGTGTEIIGARASLQETLRLLDAIGKELGRRIA